jgi:hypothetical protein
MPYVDTISSSTDAELQAALKSVDTQITDAQHLRTAIIAEMGRRCADEVRLRAGMRPNESIDAYVERVCAGIEPI